MIKKHQKLIALIAVFTYLSLLQAYTLPLAQTQSGTAVSNATQTFVLTVTRGEHVEGTPASGTYSYARGTNVRYSYAPASGYLNLEVELDKVAVANAGTIVMDANHTLTANLYGANIVVISTPPGARIYLNNVDSGFYTPHSFTFFWAVTKTVLLRYSSGYQEYSQTVSANIGQTVTVNATPKGSAVSFVTSVSTLNYQGQNTQNRVQTASLAKIERQTSSTGATYALSGEVGLQIGKDGTPAFYGVSPINVNRNIAGRLSSDIKGLSPWLTAVNGTLNGLTHRHMTSGDWEESIDLSFGDGFPATIHARFRAQPRSEPDSKWILITADSGVISFRALDVKYQDSLIYGRYKGVLVYSPTEDAFRQEAAAFTLYHGADQFRIEQLHFAADADGKQLFPVLDVGPYLNFTPEAPEIATQGAFPSWSVQAAHVLDILHLVMMTAAEGSTNPGGTTTLGQTILNPIHQQYNLLEEQSVRDLGTRDFLSGWEELQNLAKTQNQDWASKLTGLANDLAPHTTPPNFNPPGTPPINRLFYLKPLYVASKKMIDGKLYDVKLINDFPNNLPAAPPGPTAAPAPSPQPPVEMKVPGSKAGKETGSKAGKKPSTALTVFGVVLGLAGLVVGGIYLAKLIKDASSEGGGGGGGGGSVSETWKGTFQVKDVESIYGTETCAYTTKGNITFSLNRSGSSVTGKNSIADLKDSYVLLDPVMSCPPVPHCNANGDITATVDSKGNYVFTFFVLDCGDYPQFTATVTGTTMTGSFSKTSKFGPTSDVYTGSFTVTKQ